MYFEVHLRYLSLTSETTKINNDIITIFGILSLSRKKNTIQTQYKSKYFQFD
jgi:hypothetical protein